MPSSTVVKEDQESQEPKKKKRRKRKRARRRSKLDNVEAENEDGSATNPNVQPSSKFKLQDDCPDVYHEVLDFLKSVNLTENELDDKITHYWSKRSLDWGTEQLKIVAFLKHFLSPIKKEKNLEKKKESIATLRFAIEIFKDFQEIASLERERMEKSSETQPNPGGSTSPTANSASKEQGTFSSSETLPEVATTDGQRAKTEISVDIPTTDLYVGLETMRPTIVNLLNRERLTEKDLINRWTMENWEDPVKNFTLRKRKVLDLIMSHIFKIKTAETELLRAKASVTFRQMMTSVRATQIFNPSFQKNTKDKSCTPALEVLFPRFAKPTRLAITYVPDPERVDSTENENEA